MKTSILIFFILFLLIVLTLLQSYRAESCHECESKTF